MVALSRCFGSLAVLLTGVEGARVARKRAAAEPKDVQTKFIAGVPVLNYHTAYAGESSPSASDGELAGDWVVMVNADTTDVQMQSLCKTAPNGCNLMGHPQGGVPFLAMRGTENDLERLVQGANGLINFIEPDLTVQLDPEIESTNVEAATWGLSRIGADARGRSGAGATIFVLDTGVRVSHNEFGGRALSALDMTSGSLVECHGDANCASDRRGHGTHCAGTAAGESFGVAPSAAVRAMKLLNDSGSGAWSWSYEALDWLAVAMKDVRPAVASMSMGGKGNFQAYKVAVDEAVNSGVVVVVSAGNRNSDACDYSPAFIPSAITVGSTTSWDSRSSFSNYGSCTNIWAPGSDIKSAYAYSDTSTAVLSGTSMSCPHVSGGAALVLDADPSKKSSAVLAELLDGAQLNAIADLKSGDTNALLYVGEGGPPPAPKPRPTPRPAPASCDKATSTGPNFNNQCTCNSGLTCYEGRTKGCTDVYTWQTGGKSIKYHLANCTACKCK